MLHLCFCTPLLSEYSIHGGQPPGKVLDRGSSPCCMSQARLKCETRIDYSVEPLAQTLENGAYGYTRYALLLLLVIRIDDAEPDAVVNVSAT